MAQELVLGVKSVNELLACVSHVQMIVQNNVGVNQEWTAYQLTNQVVS